jgi:phosphosulfolactate phosphohydrolase-like enzyme
VSDQTNLVAADVNPLHLKPGEVRADSHRLLQLKDSAQIALRSYLEAKPNLAAALASSENARRLLAIPDLRDDVAFCMQRDIFPLVAKMEADDAIRRL